MAPEERDPFYVGYLPHMAPALARRLRPAIGLVLAGLGLAAVALAAGHRRLPVARFEFGDPVELVGRLVAGPAPWLEVSRPDASGAGESSRYLLVASGKKGLAAGEAAALDGRPVRVRGTLAFRAGTTLVEVGSIEALGADSSPGGDAPESLGRVRLEGEIVDSKCFLGVMNPGELKSHRACAARCIAGGIPPALCVREPSGRAHYVLLVGPGGRAVNDEVLDLVAEPVSVEGELVRHGDLLVLESAPGTYGRLP